MMNDVGSASADVISHYANPVSEKESPRRHRISNPGLTPASSLPPSSSPLDYPPSPSPSRSSLPAGIRRGSPHHLRARRNGSLSRRGAPPASLTRFHKYGTAPHPQ